jgi:hypothetical protein
VVEKCVKIVPIFLDKNILALVDSTPLCYIPNSALLRSFGISMEHRVDDIASTEIAYSTADKTNINGDP